MEGGIKRRKANRVAERKESLFNENGATSLKPKRLSGKKYSKASQLYQNVNNPLQLRSGVK